VDLSTTTAKLPLTSTQYTAHNPY